MANEFYITAGLPAQDNDDARGTNAFYITAGLVANDYTPPAGGGVPLSNPFGRPFTQALGRGGF